MNALAFNFVGLDPGQNGGVASICENGQGGIISQAWSFSGCTEQEIFNLIRTAAPWSAGQAHVFIELVHSMPRQGVASSFKFGRSLNGWS